MFIKANQIKLAYGDFNDLTKRTASDKIFHDKAFDIAKNKKHDGYQRGLGLMIYTSFNKKLLQEQLTMKLCLVKYQQKNYTSQLLEKLRKKKYTHILQIIFGVLILPICN